MRSRKLLAAMAILAVAFVVLAAVPAALTDSEGEGVTAPTKQTVVLTPCEGVDYEVTGATYDKNTDIVNCKTNAMTLKITLKEGYKLSGAATAPVVKIDGSTADVVSPTGGAAEGWTYTSLVTSSSDNGQICVVTVSGVEKIKYDDTPMGGTICDTQTYGVYNRAVVQSGTVVSSGATVNVNGILYVPAGVNLVIESGGIVNAARADVDGTITVKGILNLKGTSTIDGAVEVSGALNIDAGETVTLNSALTVTSKGTINCNSTGLLNVGEDGVLTIEGAAALNAKVSGKVVFDSHVEASGASTISLVADGAQVVITDYTVDYQATSKKITIDNTGAPLKYTASTKKTTNVTENQGKIEVAPGVNTSSGVGTISGITVVLGIKDTPNGTKGDIDHVNTLDISGTVATKALRDDGDALQVSTAAAVTLTGATNGKVAVTGSLVVGNDVEVAVAGPLSVTGSIDATVAAEKTNTPNKAEAKFTVSANGLTVTGEGIVKVVKAVVFTSNINAVQYDNGKTGDNIVNIYVDIESALETVNAAGNKVTALKVMGTVSMDSESGTVPSGVTLNVASGATLNVKKGYQLTFASGAVLKNSGTAINVDGVMYAADTTVTGFDAGSTVVSDVEVTGTKDKEWTNVYVALDEAKSGDTVTVTKSGAVSVTEDLTVDAGVTLVFPSTATMTVTSGKTVSVYGTLYYSNSLTGYESVATTAKAAVVLHDGGYILSDNVLKYNASASSGNDIPGAYYSMVYTKVVYAISSVTDAMGISDLIVSQTVTITGTVEEDFTFAAGKIVNTIAIGSRSTLKGNVTLDGATMTGGASNVFEGTITAGDAVMDAVIKDFTIVHDDNGLRVWKGTAEHTEIEVIAGTVMAGKAVGIRNNNDALITPKTLEVADGATLIALNLRTDGTITVEGTLEIPENANLTSKGSDGRLDNAPTLNLKKNAVVSLEDGSNCWIKSLNAGASATGLFEDSAVTVSGKIKSVANIYAASTATIDSETIGSLLHTTYYVEDEAFLTVYDQSTADVAISTIAYAPVENGYFGGTWRNAAGTAVTAGTTMIGAAGFTEVYADVDYNIYDVIIKGQNGISDVLLDGELMTDGSGQNFKIVGIAAGEYAVTAKDALGAAASVVLIVGGKEVEDNILTVSGKVTSSEHVTVEAQLMSADEPVDDGYIVAFDDELVKVTADDAAIDPFTSVKKGATIAIALNDDIAGTVYVNDKKYAGEFSLAGNVLITVVEDEEPVKEGHMVVFDPDEVEVTSGNAIVKPFTTVDDEAVIYIDLASGVAGTIRCNDTEYDATTGYKVTDDVLITVVESAPEPEPSEDVVVGIRTTEDGNVKVILAADDEGTISAGTVTVAMSYAMVDEYGIWDIDTVEITAEVEYTGSGYQIVNVDLITDNEYYEYATGLVASFEDEYGEYTSEKIQFTPLATAR